MAGLPHLRDLPATLRSLAKTGIELEPKTSFYTQLKRQLLNRKAIAKTCTKLLADSPAPTDASGFEQLMATLASPGHGLTIVRVGGFGSHLVATGHLHDSASKWRQVADEPDNNSALRSWRFECANSYNPDSICAPELLQFLAKKNAEEPSSLKHQYLFWGFSKGGNTIIEALRRSPELRNTTAAVVTAGSPLGGAAVMERLHPKFVKLAELKRSQPQAARDLLPTIVGPWVGGSQSGYGPDLFLAMYESLDELVAGAASIKIDQRQIDLKELGQADFSRTDGQAIPVFHLAGVLDLANLRAFPNLTVRDSKLTVNTDYRIASHFMELLTAPNFREFPVQDACVALQHAVIPQRHTPAGLSTKLLGVFQMDHTAFRLSPAVPGLDHEVFVDAILASIAHHLNTAGSGPSPVKEARHAK